MISKIKHNKRGDLKIIASIRRIGWPCDYKSTYKITGNENDGYTLKKLDLITLYYEKVLSINDLPYIFNFLLDLEKGR